MTVIPVAKLSPEDLSLLGNNLAPAQESDPLNRTLALHEEAIEQEEDDFFWSAVNR